MQYAKDLHSSHDFDILVEDSQEPMVLLHLDNPYHIKHLVEEYNMGEQRLHLRCHPVNDSHLLILE